jgi:hypothetical protein
VETALILLHRRLLGTDVNADIILLHRRHRFGKGDLLFMLVNRIYRNVNVLTAEKSTR